LTAAAIVTTATSSSGGLLLLSGLLVAEEDVLPSVGEKRCDEHLLVQRRPGRGRGCVLVSSGHLINDDDDVDVT
jgi:hypothetical protein